MKKFIAIVLGAGAMIACTKTSVSYEPTGEISFVSAVNKTKAVVEGTAMPDDAVLKVFGYYDQKLTELPAAGVGSNFATKYLDGVKFAKKGDVWAGSPDPYYWPKTGSILFAAYTPEDFSPALIHDLATNKFTLTDYEQPALKDTKDLLYSCYTVPASAGTVDMAFRHALSWVTFELGSGNANVFKVQSIVIKNAAKKATAVLATAEGDNDNRTWTVSSTADLSVFTGDETLGTSVEIADAKKCGLVIPTSLKDVELVINYTMEYGAAKPQAQVFSVALNTCKDAKGTLIDTWKAGNHYTYRLNFGRDEITIAPTVEQWVENNITVTEK